MDLNFKSLGQGPPLVILHGLFGTLDNWQTLAKQWAKNHTVYLVDQRNHGRSPHLPEMNYPLMAEDLANFLDQEWVHECHVLGHSMGGKTAMQFAMDFPDRVTKLVVVDMTPKRYEAGHDLIFEALKSIKLDQLSSRNEAAEQLGQFIAEKGVVQFLLKNLTRIPAGGFRWKMNLEALYNGYTNILSAIEGTPFNGPSLFVRGGKSKYVLDSDQGEIKTYFPAAQLETISTAGHWIHADQPQELLRLVNDFLQD